MGLLKKITGLGRWFGNHRFDEPHASSTRRLRICRFEEVEQRALMAADLHVGSVYYEPASGDDLQPNILQFTFQGGAPGTQLTRIVIDGDKNGDGISSGDVFFDTAPGGYGVFKSNPLSIVSHDGFQVVNTQVVDGGMRMVIDLSGFDAGETLIISVDVDEFQYVSGSTVDVNAVAEGGEFQRSKFITTFVAPHYEDITPSVLFWDAYNDEFAAAAQQAHSTLDLPPDRYAAKVDLSDMTAGAVAVATQIPLPNKLSGVVYLDNNLNNQQDGGETGLSGVTLALLKFDNGQYVTTGLTTTTDSLGNYKFDNLPIGKFSVVETQPNGYFSVGATAGKVNGQTRGVVVNPDLINAIDLLGGDTSVHNDFAESLPNSIAGFVGIDCDNNVNPPPIANVTIRLLDQNGTTIATTKTDANGRYKFDNLKAGTYTVLEEQPVGYFEGDNHVGSLGGTVDNINQLSHIVLTSNLHGVEYDFCELLPVSISGHVHVNTTGDCDNPANPPLPGVKIELLNSTGQVISTTLTNAQGYYIFDNLMPGTYGIHEVQPAGYFDGEDEAGSAGGTLANDLITQIVLISDTHAVDYNFCEVPPTGISGYAYVDINNNGIKEAGEAPIAGVKLVLRDGNGTPTGVTATTDAQGYYEFLNLPPGTYGVSEIQPAGYYDGLDTPGTAGGTALNPGDIISGATLAAGVVALNYNFGELLPVSISGQVHVNTTGDCDDPANPPLPGVTIQLLNAAGAVIATRVTDANGMYKFDNLAPGTYAVREIQPAGYFDGGQEAGSYGGTESDDLISNVVLPSGANAVEYNFCEIPPAELCGFVYVDMNNNGIKDAGEAGIGGVTVLLRDANGASLGITVVTSADGSYCFINLHPGTYGVSEVQPPGYFDGLDTPGNAGGTAHNPGDLITGAVLGPGQHGEFYNFGELPPASLQGRIDVNTTGDCENPENPPLAGVTIHLLDANGNIIATTTSDANGNYYFTNLAPGTYGVEEVQPGDYFNGGTFAGSAGGNATSNLITNIVLAAGLSAVKYNFCEIPPAVLSGHVFQDGPAIPVQNEGDVPDVLQLRDGKLTPDDRLLGGVRLELRDGVTGLPIYGSAALPGTYDPNQPISIVTDANGFYQFTGLHAGTYAVYYYQPSGYYTGIHTAGSTGGAVISPLVTTDPVLLGQLQALPTDGAIIDIGLALGGSSINNDFTVVVTAVEQIILPPGPPAPPIAFPTVAIPEIPPVLPLIPTQLPFLLPPVLTRAGGQLYTWHLSIVDAGHPRGQIDSPGEVQFTAYRSDEQIHWHDGELNEVEWTIGELENGKVKTRKMRFGMKNSTPLAGDFNGDGKFEVAVFKDGYWFIDLNDNGAWDNGDLWAKLGHKNDLPVAGDWDGDGKTDIGIYGPAWVGDPRAVAHEPGLPDPYNDTIGKHKNIPRPQEQTSVGHRTLKLTSDGKPRADLIDHVFFYGTPGDHPTVGDWNGDGIDTIGIFRDGMWRRDTDGDGKTSRTDTTAKFGHKGDIPVVGDFDGDGIEELGVFRDGVWIIDTNGNGVIDDSDQTFELGGPGDVPVVGDWNGDGRSDPGVMHQNAVHTAKK